MEYFYGFPNQERLLFTFLTQQKQGKSRLHVLKSSLNLLQWFVMKFQRLEIDDIPCIFNRQQNSALQKGSHGFFNAKFAHSKLYIFTSIYLMSRSRGTHACLFFPDYQACTHTRVQKRKKTYNKKVTD